MEEHNFSKSKFGKTHEPATAGKSSTSA